MSGWTDAHCHLQDRYRGDDESRGLDASEAVRRAVAGGVTRAVVIGTDATTSREALQLVDALSTELDMHATVGLHPHDAEQDVAEIQALARRGHPRLVGIGECGLDYYYEHAPKAAQRVSFATQIALAHELDLALVIHARDAWDDLFAVLDSEGMPPRTVIHCFTGGPAEAERCLAAGADISISGIVTFKNATDVRSAVLVTPLDRLHVETDSPFLTPVPHRGRPNEPAYVALVGECVAGLLNLPVETVRRQTAKNTARLFAISG